MNVCLVHQLKVIDQRPFANAGNRKHQSYVWLNQLSLRVIFPSEFIDLFQLNIWKMNQRIDHTND